MTDAFVEDCLNGVDYEEALENERERQRDENNRAIIIGVLEGIKGLCSSDCNCNCPFYDFMDNCLIHDYLPMNWDIKRIKVAIE